MENRETILEEVKKTICKDRNYLYGKPEQSFTEIAKVWSFYLGIDLKAEDAAIMLALFKVARMKTSVSFNKDNFLDAIGYFACAFEVATERVEEENKNVKKYVAEVRGEIGEIKKGDAVEALPLDRTKTPDCFGNFRQCAECLDFCWCQKSCKTKTLSESSMDCVLACFECYDGGTDCKVCLYEEACEEACVESCAVEEKVKEEKPVEEKPKHKKKNKKKNNKKSVDK